MPLPAVTRSLSARLLVLTVFFVMVAEVLIYTPSIARFRLTWLEDKLAAGHLAALALVATPEQMVTRDFEEELLAHVGAYAVDLRRANSSTYMLGGDDMPPPVDLEVDLRDRAVAGLILDAYDTLLSGSDRVIEVAGWSPRDPEAYVEMVLDERPLRTAMVAFSWRILGLSIVISLITASLVFLSLRWLMVRPLSRFTLKMVAFRDDPEEAANVIQPSARGDEIGVAERELHDMQIALRTALKQKTRLAALGTAVTKINHDLRNILSTAALVSERLAASGDPEVQRSVPRLVDAIDRAVDLCQHTLDYTREGGPPLQRQRLDLRHLVGDAEADLAAVVNGRSRWVNEVPEGIALQADREQILRVLVNLGRNAFESGAETVTVSASQADGKVTLTLADDGPGLPPRAREHLFQPFAGTARKGGTGLGLAIAREIAVAHRGDLQLLATSGKGTVFRLDLPG
jgi:signal transduction histidine kinase